MVPNKVQTEVHTGLFVDWDKRSLLLHVVQELLRIRFSTCAVSGPQLSSRTCEILLLPLNPGANLPAAKELLVTYLSMIKESKPNVFLEKNPVLIDLESDDEVTEKESVEVVELDGSYRHSEVKDSDRGHLSNVGLVDSDIIVIDSINDRIAPSKSTCTGVQDCTGIVLKESNRQGRKRKIDSGKGYEGSIEIVDIVDDDVIVLDDSLTPSSKEVDVTVVGPTKNDKSEKQLQSKSTLPSTSNDIVNVSSDSLLPSPSAANDSDVLREGENVSSSCKNSIMVVSLNSSPPPKKKSKLTYRRPAHLVMPLTVPSSAAATTDSVANIYNPNPGTSETRTGLRPIVIDGNNVAISHGKGHFSLKGIQICINFFEKRGHRQIKAFVPQYRKNKDTHDEIHKMERQGTIVVTPSRKVNGKTLASYDDRYIVQYAAEFGGVIVSTDNYRDLLSENPTWRETIEKRLLMFTWVDDLLMFPQDPLGRNGPSLDDFLKFSDS